MKTTKHLLLVLLLSLVCYACRQQPLFGKDYNQKRVEVGIPIIPDTWNGEVSGPNEATWRNPDLDSLMSAKIPFHESKYVNYKSGVLTYEQDAYFGYNDFMNDGSLLREQLHITYRYNNSKTDILGVQELNWTAQYTSKDGIFQDVSLNKAKEILKSWGLSYP
jgi:hypothetical protein